MTPQAQRASAGARFIAGWAALATLALAALAGMIMLAPEKLVGPDTLAKRTGSLPAAHVALLAGRDGRPSLIASAPRHSNKLELTVLRPAVAVPGMRFVLWAQPAAGERFALCAIDLATTRSRLELKGSAEQALGNVATLSVSAEPVADALPAQPTQPPLLGGPCVKTW